MVQNPFCPAGFLQLDFNMTKSKTRELTAKTLPKLFGDCLASKNGALLCDRVCPRFPKAQLIGRVFPLTLYLVEDGLLVLRKHFAGAKRLRLVIHILLLLRVDACLKRGHPIQQLSCNSVNFGRNWLEVGAIFSNITVFTQGENDCLATALSGLERYPDGARNSLVLDVDLRKGLLYLFGKHLKVRKCIPALDESLSNLRSSRSVVEATNASNASSRCRAAWSRSCWQSTHCALSPTTGNGSSE